MKSDRTMKSQTPMMVSFLPRTRNGLHRAEPRQLGRGLSSVLAWARLVSARRASCSTTLLVGAVAVALTAGCSASPFTVREARFDPVRDGEVQEYRTGVNDPEGLSAIQDFLARTAEYGIEESPGTPATTSGASARTGDTPWAPAGRPRINESINQRPRTNVSLAAATPAKMMPGLALPVVGSVAIRPIAHVEPAPAPKRPAPTIVNMPLDTNTTQPPMDLAGIVPSLEVEAEDEEDFDAQWQLRLTQLALYRDDQAADIPPGLPGGNILAALMRTASAVRRVARDPSGPGDEAVTSVDALARLLSANADPQVTTVRMCRKVVTFGVYEEMLETEFVAGRSVRTIVYSELRNLRSEQTDDGQFRTHLATRIEVLSIDGESVWQEEVPEIVDLCRVPRRDFFVAQRISLPPTLPAGDYVLKVLVEDKLSGKADEGTLAFSIKSQFSIANGG